ncbi:UDP-N-acetylmuramate--L-alanine ligase [Candidatus Leptofilum sp.]|uniref:UDP-N-acetylmuramate--L-alanine ligase n=1 Tax=Candidatus Leptofilum sp. TaxID=3241576 RepID=UPI003B5BAE42
MIQDLFLEMSEEQLPLQPNMHIHLIGIGGSGISAIAKVLLGRGFTVSGSDMQANESTAALANEGATIYQGHAAANIAGAELLVISSAIPEENPEVQAARKANIPVMKRSDFLGRLMADRIGIAIAGTHGKTTTTGLIAHILMEAELDPTVIVGGILPSLEGNGRFGEGDYFVVEADEYDHMFLGLKPEMAIITNIEHDHPDIFPSEESYRDAFAQFAKLLPESGHLIACATDEETAVLLQNLALNEVQISTYALGNAEGKQPTADYLALDLRPNQLGGTDFLVESEGEMIGLARLRLPGEHNVLNALAAIIVATDLGVDFNVIRAALASFSGVNRRFELIGEMGNVTIIDDYAHHPTEIAVTLKAARQRYPGRRLWAVWQPHTFSRTKLLLDKFATCFTEADKVVALDIYKSRETDSLGLDTAVVLETMNHPSAVHIPDLDDAAKYILDRVRPHDVVLTLGAGDGNQVAQQVLAGIQLWSDV